MPKQSPTSPPSQVIWGLLRRQKPPPRNDRWHAFLRLHMPADGHEILAMTICGVMMEDSVGDNPLDKVLRLKRANPQRAFDSRARRLPPGQYLTEKFPVLHYGSVPRFDPKTWDFKVWGLVENPIRLTWEEFLKLPTQRIVTDIHCVTRWSKFDTAWEGVPWSWVMESAKPKPEAKFIMAHCEYGFTANAPLEEMLKPGVMLAYKYADQPLEPEHGYPLRLLVPHLYFWKSAKWLRGIEFMANDKPGFWEGYGYHMRGDPFLEERFQ